MMWHCCQLQLNRIKKTKFEFISGRIKFVVLIFSKKIIFVDLMISLQAAIEQASMLNHQYSNGSVSMDGVEDLSMKSNRNSSSDNLIKYESPSRWVNQYYSYFLCVLVLVIRYIHKFSEVFNIEIFSKIFLTRLRHVKEVTI